MMGSLHEYLQLSYNRLNQNLIKSIKLTLMPHSRMSNFFLKLILHVPRKPGGGDLVRSMPGCVCPKVKDMGPE